MSNARHLYTPLADEDSKLDIMEHVNQDHAEELLAILSHYHADYCANHAIADARIADVYVEGMDIAVYTEKTEAKATTSEQTPRDTLYVPFELQGDIEEQVLYLAYMAMAKLGKDLTGNKQQYFEVVGKQKLTKNMMRLMLKSEAPLPQDYAGYAYGMVLKTLNKTPETLSKSLPLQPLEPLLKHAKVLLNTYGTQAFLWGLKKASSEQRQKIVKTMNKDLRLYTLRKSWQSEAAEFVDCGYMDIFVHGEGDNESAGSRWARRLNIGDVVFSRTETADKHAHLHSGQTVLIADETAYPALAGILENWENPTAPHIVVLSQYEAEQSYLRREIDNEFLQNCVIETIVCPVTEQGERVKAVLAEIEHIDGVWGAFENAQCKTVRHYLRNERHLAGKNNHIKGYWQLNK